jgi:hypothetical protein
VMKSNCMIDFTHGMSLHDHAKKNQYFLKNTSTQVVLDKHAGVLCCHIGPLTSRPVSYMSLLQNERLRGSRSNIFSVVSLPIRNFVL